MDRIIKNIIVFIFITPICIIAKQDVATQDLIAKIYEIYAQSTPTHNIISQKPMQCLLNKQELKQITLHYPDTLYEYYNMLLETNRKDISPSKLTQDLLVKTIWDKNVLSTLLGLQLYFTKQCERCERVRDITHFDYYRDKSTSMQQFLAIQGGNFAQSYVAQGEAFLCQALSTHDSKDYLLAYANLMMSGNHTRAINALLSAIAQSNDNVLFATFKLLIANDFVIIKNPYALHLLNALSLQNKSSNFNNIQSLPSFKNLKVLENSIDSDYILQTLLIRDMEIGRILSPFNKLANKDTIAEYYAKQQHYENEIKATNIQILQRATFDELMQYYKILELKSRLKHVQEYPYATTYLQDQ